MAVERGGACKAGARREWRAQRSPIPIRARDVRERRHGRFLTPALGGVVENEMHCGHACPASLRILGDFDAKETSPQRVAPCGEHVIAAALEQRENSQRLVSLLAPRTLGTSLTSGISSAGKRENDPTMTAEANQLVTTPRRRHDGHECSEERKRLGFGETPFKQMPAISPFESGKRRAALENSLQSPMAQDCFAQPVDSRFPVKLLEHELGFDEGAAPKIDLALHVSEARLLEHRSNQESGSESRRSPYQQRVRNAMQPVRPRVSIHARESQKRGSLTCSIRRSSPIGRSQCKADGSSSSYAACGGA